ncbi:type II toxin-antitoxin system HicB family antitoxin [Candidatus Micrarchaeota archaeon]|nr:type II toxin-antitoxin system HicB family antitoxin [Candidatus Micrarchaeota archaeon]MBU2476830.1 type II toxin-antitoxin system HicB family antitoxin [Candidatus Micrarchaeota archaeon]
MKLDIVFEKQKEGGYTVYVPALKGCISEGETKRDALKNIKEAISLYLEEAEKDKVKEFFNSVSVEKTEVKVNA